MQYTNDPASQSGDFVSLGMRDGRVEYRFDMGSGPTTITSGPVDLDVWHDITFSRNKKDGKIYQDTHHPHPPPLHTHTVHVYLRLNEVIQYIYILKLIKFFHLIFKYRFLL